MCNRQMQVKFLKARVQAAAFALDVADRETYHDTTAVQSVYLDDIVAAYKGKITVIKSKPAARKLSASTVATVSAMRRASAIARATR